MTDERSAGCLGSIMKEGRKLLLPYVYYKDNSINDK